jgi:hypothetical protein
MTSTKAYNFGNPVCRNRSALGPLLTKWLQHSRLPARPPESRLSRRQPCLASMVLHDS